MGSQPHRHLPRWRARLALALAALIAGAAFGWGSRPAPAAAPADDTAVVGGRLAALAANNPAAPATVTISALSPTCVRPVLNTGVCYVTWSYFSVTLSSSSEYVISLTVLIDDQVRANMAGFFQTSAYLPGDMFGPGFKVACGAPGAGGDPFFGANYRTLLLARGTGDSGSGRLGAEVSCPADLAKLYIPTILKPLAP